MKQKKILMNRLINNLKSRDFKDIHLKSRDSQTDVSYAPNVLAYKNGRLHLFDVKAKLTDKIAFLIRKWKYLSDIALETGAKFKIIVPKQELSVASFIARHNHIKVPIQAM